MLKAFPHLRNVRFPTIGDGTVSLLIGADVPEALRVLAVRHGQGLSPDAIKTPLGWSLLGPAFECPSRAGDLDVRAAHVMFLRDESDVLVDGDLDDQGYLTSFSPVSADNRKAYRLMEETVRFCDGGITSCPSAEVRPSASTGQPENGSETSLWIATPSGQGRGRGRAMQVRAKDAIDLGRRIC